MRAKLTRNLLFMSYIILINIFLIACKKDTILEEHANSPEFDQMVKTKENYDQFAKILSKAVTENADLREFIQKSALEQFNKDYDVFYHFVKNKPLVDNKTFREVLKEFEEYPNQLDSIETSSPLLTIFVPTLPEGSFDPENWDSRNDVPLVSTDLMDADATIPVYEDGRKVLALESKEIPGFPVLVVKSNERVVLKEPELKASRQIANLSENSYEFLSPAFDGTGESSLNSNNDKNALLKSERNKSARVNSTIDPAVIEAYEIFGTTPDYWQRDYIYYGLTKSDTKGSLKTNFVETISTITLTRDALNKMMDQPEDPKLTDRDDHEIYIPEGYERAKLLGYTQPNAWTDGKFELHISVGINNISGAGSVYDNYFPVDPTEAFFINSSFTRTPKAGDTRIFITYTHNSNPSRGFKSKPIDIDFEITPWSLEKNSPIWKINVAETDASETRTTTEESNVEFAANFEASLSILEKVGLKFGISGKEMHKSTLSWVTQYDDDDLGNVLVDFGDPVITNDFHKLKAYSNKYYELTLLPKKVY